RNDDPDWTEVPHAFPTGYGRAVGLADMAYAIRSGRKFRANGDQAFTVVDLMQGFLDSAAQGKAYEPKTRYERPTAMPRGLRFGTLEDWARGRETVTRFLARPYTDSPSDAPAPDDGLHAMPAA